MTGIEFKRVLHCSFLMLVWALFKLVVSSARGRNIRGGAKAMDLMAGLS